MHTEQEHRFLFHSLVQGEALPSVVTDLPARPEVFAATTNGLVEINASVGPKAIEAAALQGNTAQAGLTLANAPKVAAIDALPGFPNTLPVVGPEIIPALALGVLVAYGLALGMKKVREATREVFSV